ncbi:MAG TPA: DUF732 domain-containing protein [Rhodopila sp.]
MLGLATLLGAGPAHAGTPDDQFLAALHQQGIGFGNPRSAIGVGHHVCDALGQGMEPSQISRQLASHNPQIDPQTGVLITVDAAQSYCLAGTAHADQGTDFQSPSGDILCALSWGQDINNPSAPSPATLSLRG